MTHINHGLKHNNASVLCFLRGCREKFMETQPTQSTIKVDGSGLFLTDNPLSFYYMACVGNLLLHTKQLLLINIENSQLTKQHLEVLNLSIGNDLNKVNIN